jgi:hypothetical protein
MNRLTYWLWTLCIVMVFIAACTLLGPADRPPAFAWSVIAAYVISLGVLRYRRALDMGSRQPLAWAIFGTIPLFHLMCGCYQSAASATPATSQPVPAE